MIPKDRVCSTDDTGFQLFFYGITLQAFWQMGRQIFTKHINTERLVSK